MFLLKKKNSQLNLVKKLYHRQMIKRKKKMQCKCNTGLILLRIDPEGSCRVYNTLILGSKVYFTTLLVKMLLL